ncbi:hypothetical protein ES703_28587 [subsurface metagenome]
MRPRSEKRVDRRPIQRSRVEPRRRPADLHQMPQDLQDLLWFGDDGENSYRGTTSAIGQENARISTEEAATMFQTYRKRAIGWPGWRQKQSEERWRGCFLPAMYTTGNGRLSGKGLGSCCGIDYRAGSGGNDYRYQRPDPGLFSRKTIFKRGLMHHP